MNEKNSAQTRVLIIGAGASGLMAAVTAGSSGDLVTVFDGNEKIGKKLYATGNGKCNFTNLSCSSEDFFSSEQGFPKPVLEAFPLEKTLAFFCNLGLPWRADDAGRVYPHSEQATAVVSALRDAATDKGVKFILRDKVASVKKKPGGSRSENSQNGTFVVEMTSGSQHVGDILVVATGGRAGLQFGSTGDGYGFAKSFGHTLVPPRPALAPLMCKSEKGLLFKELKGVRVKGRATLRRDQEILDEEDGEIQFTDSGLSGICIFNLSRRVEARRNYKGGDDDAGPEYIIHLDLVPNQREEALSEYLSGLFVTMDPGQVLGRIVNEKLGKMLYLRCENDAEPAKAAAHLLKNLEISVIGTHGWDAAQTTWGGVNAAEVDPFTLESKLVENLYFAGEVLDVDGKCGGFNLQWAWSSGAVAGHHEKRSQKVFQR